MAADKIPFLFNYITISIHGECKERFINLCKNRGVGLVNLHRTGECVTCMVKRSRFKMLRPIQHITGCRIKIIRKQGTRHIAFKYRKHYSFVIGMLLAAFLIKWINLYIWDISLSGNYVYSDSYIESYLSGIGVSVGMNVSAVDCGQLEMKLREDLDGITWVSVSKHGTRLSISLKENDGADTQTEDISHENIYASDDGIIMEIIVRSGTPMVHSGDSVCSGQLLVSGSIIIEDAYGVQMDVVNTAADADILIQTVFEYEDMIERNYTRKEYTGKKKKSVIAQAAGKKITLLKRSLEDNWDSYVENIDVRLFNLISLPVGVSIISHEEYEICEDTYTDDEMRLILSDRFDSYIKNLQNSVQILGNNVKITEDNECFKMTGSISVVAPCVQYEAVTQ